MNKQLSIGFEKTLLELQGGFPKGFSTKHCLLFMPKKWEHAPNNGKAFGTLLTHLSKAFDCKCHELLTAKLKAYVWHVTFSFKASV